MANFLPSGVGGSTGAALATASNLHISATVTYVDSATGSDTYTGLSRDFPKATLASALSSVTEGDIVVLLDGHAETVTSGASLTTDGIQIIGEGSSGGQPTVTLTCDGSVVPLTISCDGVLVANIKFKPHTSAYSNSFITFGVAADSCSVVGCRFEQDENADAAAVTVNSGADWLRFTDCTFVSTASTVGATPRSAISFAGSSEGLVMSGCTFDGGTVGWDSDGDGTANPWAVDGDTSALTSMAVTGLSLLNGAVFKVNSSSTGHIQTSTVSGGGRVEW